MQWNEQDQEYRCPQGHHMPFAGVQQRTTNNGFVQAMAQYMAPPECAACPLRNACAINKGDRVVEVNHRLDHLRRQAFTKLTSDEGIAHREQRPHDVETVFGNIKSNLGFRRFLLRGIEKVGVGTGLLLSAQNLRKWAANRTEKDLLTRRSIMRSFYPVEQAEFLHAAA